MATTKKRINVTLSRDVERAITKLAKRDQVPEATKAGELIRLALEIEEDAVWDQLATERLKSSKGFISHEEVWK